MTNRFKIIPALLTPFKNDKPNLESLREHVSRLMSVGINSFFVGGTAGLGLLMSVEDRLEVIRCVVEESERGGGQVLVHISSMVLEDSIRIIKESEKLEVEGLVTLPPLYYKSTDYLYLSNYFRKLREKTQLPILLYNNPRYMGFNISTDVYSKLVREFELSGIKDSSGNLEQLTSYLSVCEGKLVFNGSDSTILPSIIIGAHGAISAIANIAPKLVLSLIDCFERGDYKGAARYQRKIYRLREVLKSFPAFSGYYAAMNLVQPGFGEPKTPMRALTREEKLKLERELESLELLL